MFIGTLQLSCMEKIISVEKYHTVGIVPKSNANIEEKDKVDTTNTQIRDRSSSWLDSGISIKS